MPPPPTPPYPPESPSPSWPVSPAVDKGIAAIISASLGASVGVVVLASFGLCALYACLHVRWMRSLGARARRVEKARKVGPPSVRSSARVYPADDKTPTTDSLQKDSGTDCKMEADAPLAGCGWSAALALLVCGHGCSADAAIAARAFAPPETSSYTVKPAEGEVEAGDASGGSRPVTVALSSAAPAVAPGVQTSCTVRILRTLRKNEIVVFHFRCCGKSRCTLLWSHSNAVDCGLQYALMASIAERLQVDIITYDYSGYGCSTGKPSEIDMYASILAVFEHIVHIKADRDLVLYGNSIGSAPTLWLATYVSSGIGSVVLHAPFSSGVRAMLPPSALAGCCAPSRVFRRCDPFDNRLRIRMVRCPVLMIHGTDDQAIGPEQSAELLENTPAAFRRARGVALIKGGGHDNLTESETYYTSLSEFLPHRLSA